MESAGSKTSQTRRDRGRVPTAPIPTSTVRSTRPRTHRTADSPTHLRLGATYAHMLRPNLCSSCQTVHPACPCNECNEWAVRSNGPRDACVRTGTFSPLHIYTTYTPLIHTHLFRHLFVTRLTLPLTAPPAAPVQPASAYLLAYLLTYVRTYLLAYLLTYLLTHLLRRPLLPCRPPLVQWMSGSLSSAPVTVDGPHWHW